MENNQACVWATRKALWDSFLNDPELTRAIDELRNENQHNAEAGKSASAEVAEPQSSGQQAAVNDQADEKEKQKIGARLRAYETPITDEILRQSIR